MRNLILILLIAGVAACGSEAVTSSNSGMISVRVRDDRGDPVDRAQVIVTLSETSVVDSRTKGDGTADIDVPAGIYRVSVVPRVGYLGGADPLSKSVAVDVNTKATVAFTLNRAGTSAAEPPPERTAN